MKLEKKMATLLVATLIAMMGVMPALAIYTDEQTVPLSVTVNRIIAPSIILTGTAVFPTVDMSTDEQILDATSDLTLTVAGIPAVTVDAELRDIETEAILGTGDFFYDHMSGEVDKGLGGAAAFASVDAFSITHEGVAAPYTIDLTIAVPPDYFGTEEATLVFWIVLTP